MILIIFFNVDCVLFGSDLCFARFRIMKLFSLIDFCWFFYLGLLFLSYFVREFGFYCLVLN